ncbi:hypothetical protein [Rhodocaloribacter sp.]
MMRHHRRRLVLALATVVTAALVLGCGPPRKIVPSKSIVPASAREVDVKGKLKKRQISIVEELLIGEPGVYVDGRTVRIRGSRRGPLWVIDGFYTDTPAGLNPRDIARMWIVPDGSGYGRRGANGVVIIQTKIGKEERGSG